MLYYIVPPIIIVLSLSFLVTFLFRKFSAEGRGSFELLENISDTGKGIRANRAGAFFSNLWFRILERITQKMKLLSLKMHNASNSWFHSARKRRGMSTLTETEQHSEVMISSKENEKKERQSEKVDEKNINLAQESIVIRRKPRLDNFSIKQRLVRRSTRTIKPEEPLRNEPKEKNRLEDALIKRIAVNPKDIEAYERLGDYYSDMKNLKDALECYRQVTKLSPRNIKAKVKMKSLERILKR